MEIVPGVHALRVLGSKAHLIVEDEITLIDAGHRGSGRLGPRYLEPIGGAPRGLPRIGLTPRPPGSGLLVQRYLERIGRSPRDVTRIVCTHGHPDHIGGVAEIAAASGAAIHIHPSDAARVRRRP